MVQNICCIVIQRPILCFRQVHEEDVGSVVEARLLSENEDGDSGELVPGEWETFTLIEYSTSPSNNRTVLYACFILKYMPLD